MVELQDSIGGRVIPNGKNATLIEVGVIGYHGSAQTQVIKLLCRPGLSDGEQQQGRVSKAASKAVEKSEVSLARQCWVMERKRLSNRRRSHRRVLKRMSLAIFSCTECVLDLHQALSSVRRRYALEWCLRD